MKNEWKVAIPNPLAWAIRRIRMHIAVRAWNRDIEWITAHVVEGPLYAPGTIWSWSQLVWQEIAMWISIGKRVTEKDFAWLCDRRGFTTLQRAYLRRMLKRVWLGVAGGGPDAAAGAISAVSRRARGDQGGLRTRCTTRR